MTQDRVVRMQEVCHLTGLSSRTIQRKEANQTFPAKRQLSPHCIGWRLSDITAWLESLR